MGLYWLVLGDTGLVLGATGWYFVVVVLVLEWYWLIYDGAVSVEGGTGWYLMELG